MNFEYLTQTELFFFFKIIYSLPSMMLGLYLFMNKIFGKLHNSLIDKDGD